MKEEEIKLLNLQIFGIVITLITAIFSIIITYNKKCKLAGKKSFFESVNSFTLILLNRLLIFIVALIFLYINYKFYKIAKENNKKLKNFILQIITSYLTLTSAIITLYIVLTSNKNNIVNFENPTS